jgi:hypothetical protein
MLGMNQLKRTQLETVFGNGPGRHAVVWAIERETEKAWLIKTAGGQIWMPKYLWRDNHPGIGSAEFRIKERFELFEKISSSNDSSLLPVKKAGKGSTEKSVKVSFRVRRADNPDNPPYKEVVRSATVPVSLLVQEGNGSWYLPLWCIKQKLKTFEYLVEKACWPGLAAVQNELREGLAISLKLQAAHELAAALEREKNRQDAPVLFVILVPQLWLPLLGISEQLAEEELGDALKNVLDHLLSNVDPIDDALSAQLVQPPVGPSVQGKNFRVSIALEGGPASKLTALANTLLLTPAPIAKRLLGLAVNGKVVIPNEV